MKGRNQHTISRKMMEDELASLIKQIVDLISNEDMRTELQLRREREQQTETLEHLARLAELKIQSKQINKIRKEVLGILKRSTNKFVVATIESSEN